MANVEAYVYKLQNVPIGAPSTNLPEYIRNSKSIISLTRDKPHARDFDDNKCFFRAFALHEQASIHALERHTEQLKQALERHTNKSFDAGVNITDLPALEVYFKVAINVFSLQPDGSAKLLYL